MTGQVLLDALIEANRDIRSDYHLTLGVAIAQLSEMRSDNIVLFDWNQLSPHREMSYRGYYSDLAFDWSNDECSVEKLLAVCKRAEGHSYGGYKGGDFVMDEKTPLWAATYGNTGRAIINIQSTEDRAVLVTKEL